MILNFLSFQLSVLDTFWSILILIFRSASSSRNRKGKKTKHTEQKVLNSNNLLIYYTTICKDLLVLLSPPVCVGVCLRFCFTCQYFYPPLTIGLVLLSPPTNYQRIMLVLLSPLTKDCVSTSVPPPYLRIVLYLFPLLSKDCVSISVPPI